MRCQEVDELTYPRLLSAGAFVLRDDQAGQNLDGVVFERREVGGLVAHRAARRGGIHRMLMLLTKCPTDEARELAGGRGLGKHLQYSAPIRSLIRHLLRSFSSLSQSTKLNGVGDWGRCPRTANSLERLALALMGF